MSAARSGWPQRLAAASFAASVVTSVSCNNGLIVPYDCDHPCLSCRLPCGECKEGSCLPPLPFGWDGPALLWFGPPAQAPECPLRAPQPAYQGFAGLIEAIECPVCACGEPTCELPVTLTGNSTSCPGDAPGTEHTPFDLPAGWDGSCVQPAMTPSSPILSVTVGDFGTTPCDPIEEAPVPLDAAPAWETIAVACRGVTEDPNACTDRGEICAPSPIAGEGEFLQCVFQDGEAFACPPEYPDKHVFYQGTRGMRSCTPCACGPVEGSNCQVDVLMYEDGACSMFAATDSISQQSISKCREGAPSTLGGIEMALVSTNGGGSCMPSGGLPTGEVTPVAASTFCCMPRPN